jgi:hypothetical protein
VRKWPSLVAFFLILSCEEYPSNPLQAPSEAKKASVIHAGTQYVPVNPPGEGLVARKVNILCFKFRADNFRAKAVELIGKATFEGPPDAQEHAFRFRTDAIDTVVPNTGTPFDVIRSIEPESTYTFFRYQFPMNEYSPFANTQGMIRVVSIDEIWAYDEEGNRSPVEPDPSED